MFSFSFRSPPAAAAAPQFLYGGGGGGSSSNSSVDDYDTNENNHPKNVQRSVVDRPTKTIISASASTTKAASASAANGRFDRGSKLPVAVAKAASAAAAAAENKSSDAALSSSSATATAAASIPIPMCVYQTWITSALPSGMAKCNSLMRAQNPELHFYLFDDDSCRVFIQKHFSSRVLSAYDNLIPGAYRADLWRYCILYRNGGVYLDAKFHGVKHFNLSRLVQEGKEYFVRDVDGKGVFNGFIMVHRKHPLMLLAIEKIVENVESLSYGMDSMDITGQTMLTRCLDELSNLNMEYVSVALRDDDEDAPMFRCKRMHFLQHVGKDTIYHPIERKVILSAYSSYQDDLAREYAKRGLKFFENAWTDKQVFRHAPAPAPLVAAPADADDEEEIDECDELSSAAERDMDVCSQK